METSFKPTILYSKICETEGGCCIFRIVPSKMLSNSSFSVPSSVPQSVPSSVPHVNDPIPSTENNDQEKVEDIEDIEDIDTDQYATPLTVKSNNRTRRRRGK